MQAIRTLCDFVTVKLHRVYYKYVGDCGWSQQQMAVPGKKPAQLIPVWHSVLCLGFFGWRRTNALLSKLYAAIDRDHEA